MCVTSTCQRLWVQVPLRTVQHFFFVCLECLHLPCFALIYITRISHTLTVCLHNHIPESGKGMRSLATLKCMVLRRALPKIPLPISTKQNPIHYSLPETNVESAVTLTSDPHNPLNASLSAPQLTSSMTLSHTDSHSILPTEPSLINVACVQSPLTDDNTSSHQPTTVEDSPPGSGSQEQSSSATPDELCSNQTHTETDLTCSPEQLTHYDKFFPELEDQGTRIMKVHSSPQLSTERMCGDCVQCSLGEVEGKERHQKETDSSHHTCTSPPSLVIPTALTEPADNRSEMELTKGASSHSVSSDDDPCTLAVVKCVMPFVETPAPHVYGHISRREPEPLYEKKPSVERSVDLL